MMRTAVLGGVLPLVMFTTSLALVPASALAEAPPTNPGAGDAAPSVPSVRPTALLQVWGTAFDQDLDPQGDPAGYGDPEDDPGFKIRRARIGLEGELPQGLFYQVVFGAASPYDSWSEGDTDIGLVDASLGWKHNGFVVEAGQQKVPYSREQLISAKNLVFTERAVSTEHMVPGRETGLVAGWAAHGLAVHLGAFNGSGSFLGDDNAGVLAAGRVEYSNAPDEAFTTWGEVDELVFAVAGNSYYNDDLSTGTLAFGGDAILRVAGLAFLVEGHRVSLSPTNTDVANPDVMASTTRLGGLAQVGYSIGAFEPAVRVSLYDDDVDTDDNGDIMELMGGVTCHAGDDWGRLGLGFVHRQELGGRALPNDTLRLWAQVRY